MKFILLLPLIFMADIEQKNKKEDQKNKKQEYIETFHIDDVTYKKIPTKMIKIK